MKKSIIRTFLVAALGLGALSLTACDVKEKEYIPGAPVKVGLICLHGEQSTYDKNFIDGLAVAAKNLGAKVDGTPIVKTNIAESQQCYNAAKDLVRQGCNVIFADSFGHEKYMLNAAKKWPGVQFCHATGTQALTAEVPNFHNAFASIYEGRYLAGYAAGLKLQKMVAAGQIKAEQKDADGNIKLGYIGAFQYAEVISGYTSWYLGVKEVVPNVVMDVTFTKSWYDFNSEKASAKSLITDSHVALISQHADSMGAPGECESSGVPNVSYNVSTAAECKNTYVSMSKINWAPYYESVVAAVYQGAQIENELNANYTGTLLTNSVQYDVADAADKLLVQAVEAELKAGTRKVFDVSKFTVTIDAAKKINTNAKVDANGHLTSYMADVKDMGDYAPDTEALKTVNGITFFDESAKRSAPYFDLTIDGIHLLNSGF